MQRKKNRWLLRAVLLMLVCSLTTMTVSLAAEAGTSGDPLVTLSYLNGTFLDSLLAKVDQKIDQRNSQLGLSGSGASSSATFSVVTLSAGQTLTGDIGCEVMLRVGSATCVSPSNPGLIDLHDDHRGPRRQSRLRHREAAGAGRIYHRLSNIV